MDEAYLRPVDLNECRRQLDQCGDVLKLMTLSPELEGAVELVRLLKAHGVVASLGHSRAQPHRLQEAVRAGLSHVCHLFNAFQRNESDRRWPWTPGLLEWILIGGELNCEVICDMHHVSPEFVRLAAKMLGPDRFLAVTDSLPGAGLPPNKYAMVDGREFSTETGAARLTSNGRLVGSVLTMNRAFENLVDRCGVDLADAARFTSSNAAGALGLADELGAIEVGRRADLAVLDAQYRCIATFLEGRMVHVA
jgi:N-acetylglucosamine-6-phosphate deacetylase